MFTEVVRNGVSAPGIPTAQTYQPTVKKHIMFANNSCQPINAINNNNLKPMKEPLVSLDLCRQRWFLVLMIGMAVLAVFNLTITFWIINALKLNDTGIGFGSFVLTKKGIDIQTDITIDGSLNAELINSLDSNQELVFNSGDNANIVLKNNDFLENSLTLGEEKLEIVSNSFQVRSTDSDGMEGILFNVEPKQITTYTKEKNLSPKLGGHKIDNSLEVNLIRGDLYHDLRLESRRQEVLINGQKNIELDSRGGDIMSQSYENTILTARDSIAFETKGLEFKNLPKFHRSVDELNIRESYQLCLCESGRLFAAKPDGVCQADEDFCLIEGTADQ